MKDKILEILNEASMGGIFPDESPTVVIYSDEFEKIADEIIKLLEP